MRAPARPHRCVVRAVHVCDDGTWAQHGWEEERTKHGLSEGTQGAPRCRHMSALNAAFSKSRLLSRSSTNVSRLCSLSTLELVYVQDGHDSDRPLGPPPWLPDLGAA